MKKPIEILDKIINQIHLGVLSFRNKKKWKGKPGEIIEKLSEEERKTLEGLKSEDISEEKTGSLAAWAGHVSDDSESTLREMKLKFDEVIKKYYG
ncbi:MAG TPA: hypothetical protein VMX17_10410 [Candidatus Glassbacteria bacterium]|nr:hypothetical protein [Candidatus Glassbacteria bacterium]